MPELLTRLEQETTRQAWTLWGAFADFAQGPLDVEPERLIKALFAPVLSGIEDLKQRKDRFGVKPDENRAAQYSKTFSEAWAHHLQGVKRLSK